MTALPADVTELLAAVVEALDIPLPDVTDADERVHARLLTQRTADVRVILASIVEFPDVSIAEDADTIRARTAGTPITYTPWQDTAPAEKDTHTGESTQLTDADADTQHGGRHQVNARKLSSTDAYRVEGARKLLADLETINWATTTEQDMAKLLGRTSVVLEGLIQTAAPANTEDGAR